MPPFTLALSVVGYACLALAMAGAVYSLVAVVLLGRFFKPSHFSLPANPPPVTIFKPLHGTEPDLLENLESFCHQDYTGPIQFVFGVQDANDPAIAVVNELKRRYPQSDITLVIDTKRDTLNPKIANLSNMLPAAKYGILVMSDADISVAPDYLTKVVAALSQDKVGAVTCCYRGEGANLWSQLASMWIDYHYLPGIVFGVETGIAAPCFGQTIALRRTTLDAIGGFAAFGDVLAEDFAIGLAVRELGATIAIADTLLINHCVEENLAALFRHELRWAFTLKTIDPVGYVGSGITHILPLAIIGAALWGFTEPTLVIVLAALAARLTVKWRVDQIPSVRPVSALLLPVRDILSFTVFVASFFVTTVQWRGTTYAVTAKGRLVPEPAGTQG